MRFFGLDYIKYLMRFGLDKSILQKYKNYRIITCSERNCADGTTKSYDFIDFAGIDYKWVEEVASLERERNIEIFHIIHNGVTKFGDEFVLMYKKYWNDSDFESAEEYNEFITGKCKCIRYYPEANIKIDGVFNYRVKLGGLHDLDFKEMEHNDEQDMSEMQEDL